jgi:hypothetical protein
MNEKKKYHTRLLCAIIESPLAEFGSTKSVGNPKTMRVPHTTSVKAYQISDLLMRNRGWSAMMVRNQASVQ